jgi:hypothetical protein
MIIRFYPMLTLKNCWRTLFPRRDVTDVEVISQRAQLNRAGLLVPQMLVTADEVKQGKPAPELYLIDIPGVEFPQIRANIAIQSLLSVQYVAMV